MANDAYIAQLIAQRMKDRCVSDFHLEPVLVRVAKDETVEIAAHNEMYVLGSTFTLKADDVPVVVTVESDDNYYRWQNSAAYRTPQFANHQDFTGQIFITSSENDSYLEFVRVIPRYVPCKSCGLNGACSCNKSMP